VRIAYFSPLGPKTNSTTDYGEELLPHLARHAQIDLFVDGYVPSNPAITRNFAVHDYLLFEKMWWQGKYDVALYHMGNDQCHEYIYRTLQQYPGITVLHDLFIHHFVANVTAGKGNADEYLAEMAYSHGEKAAEHARNMLRTGQSLPVWDYPLNRRVIDSSLGVIVHNQFCYTGVRAVNEHVPLARIAHAMQIPAGNPLARPQLGLRPDSFVVASFGLMTPAKRVDVALRAFKDLLSDVGNTVFIVVGSVSEDYDLASVADELGLGTRVRFTGRVDKETLQRYLDACDVCVNLRYPTCGETSGIALRAMAAGKPLIVSDVGSLAELPDDCCIKVPVDCQEIAGVAGALRCLANDSNVRHRMGERGRAYVRESHDPAKVAEEYMDFIRGVLEQFSFASSRPDSLRLKPAATDTAGAAQRISPTLVHATQPADIVEIMRGIRESIRASRLISSVPSDDWAARLTDVKQLREALSYHVRQAELVYGDIFVDDQMRRSSGLLGMALSRLRQPLHSLVRFYIDSLAVRQAGFNFFLAKALAAFARELDASGNGEPRELVERVYRGQDTGRDIEDARKDIEELKTAIRSLRHRAEKLETTLATMEGKGGS